MTAIVGPTRARRQLGGKLKRLREQAGKIPRDVPGDVMSITKLHKIEGGKQNVKVNDVWALCRIYNVTDNALINSLVTLARAGAEEGWWEDYKDIVPEHLGLYLGYEADASGLTFWHAEVVYGLLQTADFARAVISADDPEASAEEVERRVSFRMQRQHRVLNSADPPNLVVMLGAAAMHLEVGSRQVLAEQVRHLVTMSNHPNIEVRVVPWNAGAHAGLRGSYTLLDYDDEDAPASVIIESHAGARYMEKREAVGVYRRITERLLDDTVPIKEYMA